MAKFCGNCGTQAEDEARVCGNCGTPFEEENIGGYGETSSYYQPVDNPMTTGQQDNMKKIIALVVGVVAVALIAWGAISVVNNFTGINGMVRKVVKAYETGDASKLERHISDYLKEASEESSYDMVESLEDMIEYKVDNFDEEAGSNYKIKYEISKKKDLSDKKVEEFKETLEKFLDNLDLDFDDDEITAVKDVKVKMTAKGSEGTEKETIEIRFVKEKGRWKLWDF